MHAVLLPPSCLHNPMLIGVTSFDTKLALNQSGNNWDSGLNKLLSNRVLSACNCADKILKMLIRKYCSSNGRSSGLSHTGPALSNAFCKKLQNE